MIPFLAVVAICAGLPRPFDDRLSFLTQDAKTGRLSCLQLHTTTGVWETSWSFRRLIKGARVLDVGRVGARIGVLFEAGDTKKIAVLASASGRILAGPYAVSPWTRQVRFLGTRAVAISQSGGVAFAGEAAQSGPADTSADAAHTPDGRFIVLAKNSAMPMGGSGLSSIDVYRLRGRKIARVVSRDDHTEGENAYSLAATRTNLLVRRGPMFEAYRITPQGELVATWSKRGGNRPCPIATDGERFAVASDAGVTVLTPRGAGWSVATLPVEDLDPLGARLAFHGADLAVVDARNKVWRFQIVDGRPRSLGATSIKAVALFPVQ